MTTPRRLRLLLLEDNGLDAELSIHMLEDAAFVCEWQRVETASAFSAALANADYDVILADLNMPHFSGLAGLEMYLQKQIDVPFIFVSGTLGEEQAVECMKAGATDYVLKANLRRLAPVVERALQERSEKHRRRIAEATARDREARYRLVTQAVFDVVWDWDLDTDQVEWSEGLLALFGYPADQVGSSPTWRQDRIHPDDTLRVLTSIAAALRGAESVWSGEYRFRRADGTYASVADRAFIVRHPDGRPRRLVGAMMDVTERQRVAEEVRQLTVDLERRVAERTEQLENANHELEAFTYAVSHDLRAPLRAVDSFGVALLEDCGSQLDDRGHRHIERIRNAAARMSRLITDLLMLSRVTRQAMRWERAPLSDLASAVAEELRSSQPERRVVVDIAGAVVVDGDAGLLRLVLENLLGNAWKYTSKHPQARIAFGVAEKDGEIVYSVSDDGAGFDPRYADQLFVPFQRLHSRTEFEGSGVGLATVKRIIQRHGGRVWADATVERGATFHFTLGKRAC